MGMFSSRPESNNTWAAIPGEPLNENDPTPPLATGIGDALGLRSGDSTDITIDLSSFSSPLIGEATTIDESADGDGD